VVDKLASDSSDAYLQDASGYHGTAEEVFLPPNTEEVISILRTAHSHRTPVTVSGAGTGLTGARVPHGGIVLSLERLRNLRVERGRAFCGAGALLKDLQAEAARHRQFFGPNPTENSASLGGIFSTNAGGARSFRYGAVRLQVLAVDVVFSDGTLRHFERGEKVNFTYQAVHSPAVTKNSAGYYLRPNLEWVDLLAGSEGTLGVVTGMEVKLFPQPPAILSGVVFFTSDDRALDAVDSWRSISELRLLEFMDHHSLELLRSRYSEIPERAKAALLIEQNLASENDEEVDLWAKRLQQQDALEEASWFGFSPADQERFRVFRHTLALIVTDKVRQNGFPKASTDFSVPIERYRDLHRLYKQRCAETMADHFTIFGHVGDANTHVNVLPETPVQAKQSEELMYEFAEKVVSMGGTVAAEHGIGKTKTSLLPLMYSSDEIDSMRAVKRELDDRWLLGQGNIFPFAL
jgi:FAD/FMN-containing dehydrogenase